MAAVGTAAVPAAGGTSYRAAAPSGVSSGIYAVLEMRDGDKSNLRDKGILKALVNIIDIIAHKLLGMDVWEQPEIDRRLVETLDGTKNRWCWSEVSLWLCISKLTGMLADKFVMPQLSFNVISGGSRAGHCLACPEFLIASTRAGSGTEDMITDNEVYHTLKIRSSRGRTARCVKCW